MATRDTYTTQTWENLPSEETPLSAERLAHIENGIKDAADKRALKDIYDDSKISLGRKEGTYSGYFSVAAGAGTSAPGQSGHAIGEYTEAKNTASYAEGAWTISSGYCQHVQGKFNVEDTKGIYAHIVGGGTSSERKNIHTIDWMGNAYYAGDVTNGDGVSLNSLESAVENLSNIAGGGSIAKVFDTKADLDVWLAVEGNPDTLVVGQNIYIKATNTPDYWWDGTGLQILETDKVEIESMTYNETMSILNASAEEVE